MMSNHKKPMAAHRQSINERTLKRAAAEAQGRSLSVRKIQPTLKPVPWKEKTR
jgi:hypothetical protein